MAFPYSFAVVDNISTDIAYSSGPSAVAELIVEQINTLKHVLHLFCRRWRRQESRTTKVMN